MTISGRFELRGKYQLMVFRSSKGEMFMWLSWL